MKDAEEDTGPVDPALGYLEAVGGDRLRRQLRFVVELDRLKSVLRRTPLTDGSRRENAAEHSWHLAVMALVLEEHAPDEDLEVTRALKMLLLHDVVEIEAGDTYCYDREARRDQRQREERAARRLFGMLPEDQERRFRALWREFEERDSPEARFAAALDRLQPLLHNFLTEGRSWREHDVGRSRVEKRNRPVSEGAPRLWELVCEWLDIATRRGDLPD